MEEKLCLVTGGTSGIGRASALALAKRGARVIIVGRNEKRGSSVLQELQALDETAEPRYISADLSTLDSMKRFVETFRRDHDRLDVLLNNAGAFFTKRELTRDGFERTFALNHLGYFVVTNLLLDLLESTPGSRILSTSSDGHRMIKGMNWDDLQFEQSWPRMGWDAYCQSKLANVLFTYELAQRLANKGSHVTANCMHPGFIRTRLGQNDSRLRALGTSLVYMFAKKPEEAAKTVVYGALSKDMEGVTGKYLTNSKIVRSSKATAKPEDWQRLWQISAEMTGFG